jgi:diguanylate cyclase (GGDEF)-like protein
VAAAILCAIGALVAYSMSRGKSDARWVDHTHEVILQLQRIETEQERLSKQARGFVLFGRDADRMNFEASDQRLASLVDGLVTLVSDNPEQVRRARRLDALVVRRTDFPRRAVQASRTLGPGIVPPEVNLLEAERLHGQVVVQLGVMQGVERALLKKRVAAEGRAFMLVAASAVFGIPFALVMIGYVYRQLRREIAASATLREELKQEAIRDPLTSLFNRRYLEEAFRREVSRCARRNLPLGVVVMDLDRFKPFNDRFGHAGGDAVLLAFAQLLQGLCRGEDIPCRLGGEEFALILPEAARDATARRAEEIRAATEALLLTRDGTVLDKLTVSVGVATMPENGSERVALLGAADEAMYSAKRAGRNRVHLAQACPGQD